MPNENTGVTNHDPLAEYLAGVKERVQDVERWPLQYAQAAASQADVATLVEMVRRCQEHLIAYRPGLRSGPDKTLCELDLKDLARAAMEKNRE